MIVFDLKCANKHIFEVWFGSSGDYESQRKRGLVNCPYCGDDAVEKAVMAPHVGARGNARASASIPVASVAQDEGAPADIKAMLGTLAKMQAAMLAKSEWVGRKFADKARAMHLGEEDHSAIHGEVSADDAKALRDEGVAVSPLPFPVIPPEAQN